jgi:hypothetical protein
MKTDRARSGFGLTGENIGVFRDGGFDGPYDLVACEL